VSPRQFQQIYRPTSVEPGEGQLSDPVSRPAPASLKPAGRRGCHTTQFTTPLRHARCCTAQDLRANRDAVIRPSLWAGLRHDRSARRASSAAPNLLVAPLADRDSRNGVIITLHEPHPAAG